MELSIVLIIIGLIVGGVLGGQSLIKSAELQRVVNEFRQYETAINAFKLEFSATPGDMNNAFDYWGTDCATTEAVCNGDGNGVIKHSAKFEHEDLQAWNHLALAGIVPGNYTGLLGTKAVSIVGENVPKSSTGKGAGYTVLSANKDVYNLNAGNSVSLGTNGPRLGGGKNDYLQASVLTPKDTKAVDTKMDDGLPALGRITSSSGRDLWDGTGKTSPCVKLVDGAKSPSLGDVTDGKEVVHVLTENRKSCRIRIIIDNKRQT